jgi:hypothetical protein
MRILAMMLSAMFFAACAPTSPVLVTENGCTFDLKEVCSAYRPNQSRAHAQFLEDRDIGEIDIQTAWTVPFKSSGTEVSCATGRMTASVADAKVTKGGAFDDQDIQRVREQGLCQ